MLKTYQRETKLLEFSRDVNTEELKTKNGVTSQWVCCNRFVAMAPPKFKNKVPIFLYDRLYLKILVCRQGLLSRCQCNISGYELFHKGCREINFYNYRLKQKQKN